MVISIMVFCYFLLLLENGRLNWYSDLPDARSVSSAIAVRLSRQASFWYLPLTAPDRICMQLCTYSNIALQCSLSGRFVMAARLRDTSCV